jgi:hypothetical protein
LVKRITAKSLQWVAACIVLSALLVGTAGLVYGVYRDPSCADCQPAGALGRALKHKYLYPSHNAELSRDPKDERMDPSEDAHGDSINETQLPVFEIELSAENEAKLKDARPPWNGTPESLRKFPWPLVEAELRYEGRAWPVKLRYRGGAWDHYRMPHKKSWRVRFSGKQLFFGLKAINIVNQRPTTTIHDVFQHEILAKQGFLLAQQKLVHFRMNGQYVGVQTYLEQFSDQFLARHAMPVSQIYGDAEVMRTKEDRDDLKNWHIYSGDKTDWEPLKRLFAALDTKGTPAFKTNINAILDVEQYLSYLADAAITIKYNPSSHNIRLLFDAKKGKFQIIPGYQTTEIRLSEATPSFLPVLRPAYLAINDIALGLFEEPEYLDAYQHRMWALLNTTYHPKALLDLYDQIIAATKADILADAHRHALGEHRYVSNREWWENLDGVRRTMAAQDKMMRTTLAESHLRWTWDEEAEPGASETQKLGTLRFETESLSAPIVKEVCFSFAKGSFAKLPLGAATLSLSAPSGIVHDAFAIDGQDDRACFNLDDKLRAKLEPYGDPNVGAPGVLLVGMDFAKAVLIRGKPAQYDYALIYTPARGAEQTALPAVVSVAVNAINGITGEPIDKPVEQVVAESLAKSPAAEDYYRFSPAIDPHDTFTPSPGLKSWMTPWDEPAMAHDVVWTKAAPVTIVEDTVFGDDVRLVIEPGVQVHIAPGKSLVINGSIVAEGTELEPIRFTSTAAEPFGVIAVANTKDRQSHLRNVQIDNGSDATLSEVHYTGALSIYAADALLENVIFRNNRKGAALNAVYSHARVIHSVFTDNLGCVDYDFSGGDIQGSVFERCGGDAIDLSHSDTRVDGNIIREVADTGIAARENSMPVIANNSIEKAVTGIAVKDLSRARIVNNTITASGTGVDLAIESPEFGPPVAQLEDNIFADDKTNTRVEAGEIISGSAVQPVPRP